MLLIVNEQDFKMEDCLNSRFKFSGFMITGYEEANTILLIIVKGKDFLFWETIWWHI